MTYNGLVDITNDEYHSCEGYSKSALVTYRDSPIKFYNEYILKQKELKESDDFLLGQLVHTILLEPHKMGQYIPKPRFDKRTKQGKEDVAKFEEYAKEKNISAIDVDIYTKATDLAKNVLANSVAATILQDAECEKSIFWQDQDTGLTFKSRPDIIKGSIVADVKTCKDVTEKGFQRSCMDYGYFIQAAMAKVAMQYIGREFDRFVFICVDKTSYEVVLYILDEQAIEYGLNQYKFLAGKLAQDLQENDWLKPRIKTLSVPRWAEWEQN